MEPMSRCPCVSSGLNHEERQAESIAHCGMIRTTGPCHVENQYHHQQSSLFFLSRSRFEVVGSRKNAEQYPLTTHRSKASDTQTRGRRSISPGARDGQLRRPTYDAAADDRHFMPATVVPAYNDELHQKQHTRPHFSIKLSHSASSSLVGCDRPVKVASGPS